MGETRQADLTPYSLLVTDGHYEQNGHWPTENQQYSPSLCASQSCRVVFGVP